MRTRIALHTAAALFFAMTVACYGPSHSAQKAGAQTASADTKTLLSAPGPTFRVPGDQFFKHWTLVAYGDMRFTDPENQQVTNPKVRRWLVEQVAQEHPDALLLSGDVPYNGAVAEDYEVYRTETAVWREDRLRVYPALGNHELHPPEAREPKNWWHAFPELKDRRWYSVEMGNAYVLTLDSNLSLDEGSRQRTWLNDQLAHLPRTTEIVFVSLHHPPVADPILNDSSHNVRANEQQITTLLEKKAAATPVKFVVVAGHIHNYQRFLQNGVVYLVSGGGGAKPYPIARTPADLYQTPDVPNYHYLKFTYDGREVTASMYRLKDIEGANAEWEIKDAFSVDLPPVAPIKRVRRLAHARH